MSKNDQAPAFYVLDEDKEWARQRIAELQRAIQDLGPEFNIALNQSSETWHDNAPFDALRDTQAIMVAEMQNLKEMLFAAALKVPQPKNGQIGLGSVITVKDNAKQTRYLLVGDWSYRTGMVINGAVVISRRSPIGAALFGKKTGDKINASTNKKLTITSID